MNSEFWTILLYGKTTHHHADDHRLTTCPRFRSLILKAIDFDSNQIVTTQLNCRICNKNIRLDGNRIFPVTKPIYGASTMGRRVMLGVREEGTRRDD